MTTRRPYVGVTGFTAPTEVDEVLAVVPNGTDRLLMVGVLASRPSLAGTASKIHPERYPPADRAAKIFSDDRRALNLIHYYAPEPDGLAAQLERVRAVGGPRLHGVQLNIAWPDPDALHALDGLRVVLQLGIRAMEACSGNSEAIATRVAAYGGRIHDVLIDPSGGNGTADALGTDKALAIARAIQHRMPDLGIGIAGGLSAANLAVPAKLSRSIPDLSIDAEGRLRDSHDRLAPEAAKAYVAAGFALFARRPPSAS
jgi:hypothetical protein